jgi:hypothetical protein
VQWKSDELTTFDPKNLLVEDDVFAQPGLELVKGELASNVERKHEILRLRASAVSRAPLIARNAEFWNASTRAADKNGFGLTVTETDRLALPLNDQIS